MIVAATDEKPKRSRILAFLNAPFFLWVLSALAISFLSTFYQTRQRCLQESSALITKQFRTRNEIDSRVVYFKQAVLSAKTAKQLQELLRKRHSSSTQLKTKTLSDLIQDQNEIVSYLPFEDQLKLAQQGTSASRIINIAANTEIDDIDDEVFKELKSNITEQSPWLPNFTLFIPQCSMRSVMRLVVFGSQEYLRAIPFDRP